MCVKLGSHREIWIVKLLYKRPAGARPVAITTCTAVGHATMTCRREHTPIFNHYFKCYFGKFKNIYYRWLVVF